MTAQPTSARAPARALPTVVAAVVVGGLLVGAALTGRAVAGPPAAPNVLPPPQCPAVLAEALPATWPSSTYLVPWGPVSGRVCGYPGAAVAAPDVARLAASSTLDPTAAAELAGLVEDLPAPQARCTQPEPAAGPEIGVAVVLLRYRPGATPTVGEELRLVVGRTGPCATVSNGLRTVQLDETTFDRLVRLAPPVRQTFLAR
ncbi:hypothetical protein [Kineosporia sp. A_224]|uniref:hypothetical protein n=1 Tax=Kineosporia sp. A_224 TaxID=1962180 RepID=UPI000B4BEDE5|nr:hypothetical protein [Kineosporia sp. A_224]